MNADLLLGAVARRFGLLPRPDWPEKIMAALSAAADEHGLSPDEVAVRAEADTFLLRQLAGALVVEETHFLRDPPALRFVADHLVWLASRLGRRERIVAWSAGCSTGEEAYTLAMLLDERLPPGASPVVSILATDLNATAIAVARAARYGDWSFRNVPGPWVDRFFERDGGQYQVRAPTRSRVHFGHLSVQEQLATLPTHSLDAVLFRNVAIYLDPDVSAQLYAGFGRVLKPVGVLAVGPADPRPEGTFFQPIPHETTSLYARRLPATSEPPASARRPKPAPRRSEPSPQRAPKPVPVSIADARALADSGRLEEALALANRFTRSSPTDKSGYVVRGQIHLSAQNPKAAVADFRRAVFLSPGDLLARYWYVLALRQNGEHNELRAQLRELDQDLSSRPPGQLLDDDQTTAGELLRAARHIRGALV